MREDSSGSVNAVNPVYPAKGPDGTVAMLACASQLGALLMGVLVVGFGSDDAYGRSYDAGSPLGLVCLLVLGPPLLLVAGALHTLVVTFPTARAAGALAGRTGGAQWPWQGLMLVVLGALYAIPAASAGAPYGYSWAWASASGALPLLAVAWFRRGAQRRGYAYTTRAVWLRSVVLGGLLATAVTVVCGVGTGTGLIGVYEAPRLSEWQLFGAWKGQDGRSAIRLEEGNRAVLTGVPYESGGLEQRCDGTGRWTYTLGSGDVPATVEFDICTLATWTLGGSEDRPELYAVFGDPDGDDVRVLTKQG